MSLSLNVWPYALFASNVTKSKARRGGKRARVVVVVVVVVDGDGDRAQSSVADVDVDVIVIVFARASSGNVMSHSCHSTTSEARASFRTHRRTRASLAHSSSNMSINEAFFAVENYFHIGAYEKAIEHVAAARASASNGAEQVALAVFEARSNVALGKAKVRAANAGERSRGACAGAHARFIRVFSLALTRETRH